MSHSGKACFPERCKSLPAIWKWLFFVSCGNHWHCITVKSNIGVRAAHFNNMRVRNLMLVPVLVCLLTNTMIEINFGIFEPH